MAGWYILDENHNPIPEPDTVKASLFFGNFEQRCVAQHEIGDAHVSTVFLGLDHNFSNEGPPLLFETLVQGGTLEHMDRYATWQEAVAGHFTILRALADTLGKPLMEVLKEVTPQKEPLPPVKTKYERLLEDE